MKKLIVIAVAAGLSLMAADASARHHFVERPGADVGIRFAGDWRAANSLQRLQHELRQAGLETGGYRGRLSRIAGMSARLNYEYHWRLTGAWSIHRDAEELRAEVRSIRQNLRARSDWR